MKFAIHEVYVNIRTSGIFSFKYYWNTYGILPCKHCYSNKVFFWSVVLWINNTLYTSKFFVLVFGYYTYLTLGRLPLSLYISAAHYSILQFLVFFCPLFYMFCLHYVLQAATLEALDRPNLAELST